MRPIQGFLDENGHFVSWQEVCERLRAERDDALAATAAMRLIVDDLASMNPYDQLLCMFCNSDKWTPHETQCLWERARAASSAL